MKQAIQKLPTDLEKLYTSLLESKRGSEPLCDPRPIIAVCAAPKPMDEEALRELLALNMTTGSYASDEVSSTDAVIQSGVGLLTLDSTEKLILPVHDTVRTFIFSDAAISATNRLLHSDPRRHTLFPFQADAVYALGREMEARLSLGRACLVHLQFQLRTSRSLATVPAQIQRTLPTMRVNIPRWLQRPAQTLLPHALEKPAVTVHLPSRKRDGQSDDGFFRYARENWLACNLDLRARMDSHRPSQEELFQSIAMERTESWEIHPWQALTRSTSQHLAGMFAYSIANGHKPLLELALQHKDSLPKNIFTGLLPHHGHLPALHVACKLGHDSLLKGLSRVCELSTRCQMSKTAIHYAAEYGHMNCIEKVAMHFQGSEGTCTLDDIIDHQDSESRTALHLAITNGHKDTAVCLAGTHKASISCQDASGSTAFDLACDQGYGDDFNRLVDTATFNKLCKTDHWGRSRLILAAMAGNFHRVAGLRTICDVHEPDKAGRTALVHACREGHEHVVRSLLRSPWFKLDQELTAEFRRERLALTVAAAAGHANIIRVLLKNDFATPGPMLVNSPFQTWRPVEAAVFGHYYGVSSSLDAARVIVGEMSTSLQKPSNTSMRKYEQENLEISLRAAAEIGQVDAVRHILELQDAQPYQAPFESDGTDILRYLDRREIKTEAVEKVGIYVGTSLMPLMNLMGCQGTPYPIPVFLAAVRQHEEVLALLLSGSNPDYIQGLMERTRGIHLGCKSFDDFLKAHC